MSILAVDRPAGSGRSRHRGLLTPLMIVRPAVGGSPVIRAVVLLRWSPHRRAPPLVRVRENGPPWEDGDERPSRPSLFRMPSGARGSCHRWPTHIRSSCSGSPTVGRACRPPQPQGPIVQNSLVGALL